MNEYIVSARKYRPVSFDSVVGQAALTTTLKNAVKSGKLAHAYLFCGPRGVGKTTCARIFAKAINCMSPTAEGEACNECESCKAFNEQRSFNIFELDAASNNSVEHIKTLMEQTRIPPQVGRYKVFIIDEVHMLSTAAFNAFLKTLEEPPAHVIFILATTEKHKILPTILSRCQVFDFARITPRDIIAHLQGVAGREGVETQEEALELIAEKADGGMRDALSIFDQMVSFTGGKLSYESVCNNLNVLGTAYYLRMTDLILEKKTTDCMLLFNEILQKGFDGGNFIGGMASHFRDLLLCKDERTITLLERSEQTRTQLRQQAQRCPVKMLYKAIQLCNECDQSYRTSRNKRLQVEVCLILLSQLQEEGDASAGGLRPSHVIKPIFGQQAPGAQPVQVQATTTPATSPSPTPQPAAQQSPQQTDRKAPKLKTISGFGPSLRLQPEKADKATSLPKSPVPKQMHTPLDTDLLRMAWMEIIQKMPREEVAMAQRMRDMQPQVKNADCICITVNNNQVKQELQSLQQRILPFLQKRLGNDFLSIEIEVADTQVTQQFYTKEGIYKLMTEANPTMKLFVEQFKLELD